MDEINSRIIRLEIKRLSKLKSTLGKSKKKKIGICLKQLDLFFQKLKTYNRKIGQQERNGK